MYASGSPSKAGNTPSLPWNQSLAPKGWLWFISTQLGRFVISSNPSFMVTLQLCVTGVRPKRVGFTTRLGVGDRVGGAHGLSGQLKISIESIGEPLVS